MVSIGLVVIVVWLRYRASPVVDEPILTTSVQSVSTTTSPSSFDPNKEKKIEAEIQRIKQFPPDNKLPLFGGETKELTQVPEEAATSSSSEPTTTAPIFSLDSDNDGLSDSDEVNKYHTDPNKVDTDGDTYPDGQEVKMGYNPLGNGKCVNQDCS